MTLGDKIASERKQHNYTQEQLAQLLEVSRQSVSKWESDSAYPETEKLIKMGRIFGCSMDYLLNENCNDREGRIYLSPEESPESKEEESPPEKDNAPKVSAVEKAGRIYDKIFTERKCSKTFLGLPLYHIGKNAKGVLAIGLNAKGILAIGLMARGIFTLGLISIGIFGFGLITLALAASGVFSVGGLAFGAISAGIVSFGAVSFGVVAVGGAAFGDFTIGAYSVGRYVAIGDHSRGLVALGLTRAEGTAFSFVGNLGENTLSADQLSDIKSILQYNIPSYLAIPSYIFEKIIDILFHISILF